MVDPPGGQEGIIVMADQAASVPVLADPQFTTIRTLRPIENFTEVYQGQDGNRPIMWTENGDDIDRLARVEGPARGYASNLLKGNAVPFGSRVVIKFPALVWLADPPSDYDPYVWDIVWRVRSLRDYRLDRNYTWHLPRQGTGAADTTVPTNQQRVLLPAIRQSITYVQTEPADPLDEVIQNVYAESYRIGRSSDGLQNLPLLKDGSEGYYEQGVVNPALSGEPGTPSFMVMEFQAVGDEILIGMRRAGDGVPDWDFATAASTDGLTGQVLNASPDSGVLLLTGSAP
jgi:hypothetical protein